VAGAWLASFNCESPNLSILSDVRSTGMVILTDCKSRACCLLREQERIVRDALKSHGGSEVKTMGDGAEP
jgi:hypothetical protein